MQKKGMQKKRRRLKKSVKIGLIVMACIIAVDVLIFTGVIQVNQIKGYFIFSPEPRVNNPNIQKFIINFSTQPVKMGENQWTMFQKYQVGKDQDCKVDCVNFCEAKQLDYHKAYSQSWGKCMCKCEIPTK